MKKSKSIARVLGYTAEPERVFAEANKLCGRLNREGATAAAPPAWLRKQYSVPRPAGVTIERTSTDFTAAQVRSIRLRVMKDQLLTAGFVIGKDATYVRRHEEQVHLINFQGSKYGHEFTVNLAFHYSFVPPLFHRRTMPLAHLHVLDCIIRERIGRFLPGKRDTWFKYCEDRGELITELSQCATTCLAIFDRYAKRWSDPSVFLDDFSDVGISEWDSRPDDLAIACVALKAGRLEDVKSRLEHWNDDRYPKPPPFHEWLSNKLIEHQRRKSEGVGSVLLPDWLAPTDSPISLC